MTRRFSLAAGALLLVAIAGCSVTRTLPRRDLNYESSTRILLKVELYLASDEGLRKARWQTGSGQTIIVEMGDALAAGTEQLARALFTDVVVTSSVTATDAGSAILAPRVVLVEQSRPIFTFQDQHTTIVLEWTLRDVDGHTVWMKTVRSHKQAEMGGIRDAVSNSEQLVGEVVDDLLRQSFQVLSTSAEIQKFAAEHPK